jgi:hypothetical protein
VGGSGGLVDVWWMPMALLCVVVVDSDAAALCGSVGLVDNAAA